MASCSMLLRYRLFKMLFFYVYHGCICVFFLFHIVIIVSLHPVFLLSYLPPLILTSFYPLSSPDASGQQQPSSVGAQPHSGASDPGPIRATAPMWRCSRIMHMQRELHPTLLSSLEGIVDQMVWFRENWHEEVRRTKVLVFVRVYTLSRACVCVFHGSDGEKKTQLVARIFMHLCICVKGSWSARLVYARVMPPGQPDDRRLADPVSLVG